MGAELAMAGARGTVWAEALDRANLGVWDWDLRTGACFYSDTWYRMLGYEPGDLRPTGDLWLTLIHPDDRERAVASGDRHLRGECPVIEAEMRLRHKAGHWVWVLDRGGIVERDEAGRPVRMVGVQTDITRQKAAESTLSSVKERFVLALAASGTGIWYFDIATRTSFWDTHTRAIFGLEPGEGVVPSDTWNRFLHPDDAENALARHHDPALFDGGDMQMRYRIVRADGEVRHVETLARFSGDPHPSGSIVGTIRDVTDEVKAVDSLHTEKERLRVTLGSVSDGVISTDHRDRVTFANPAAAEMLGMPVHYLVGRERTALFSAWRGKPVLAGFDAAAAGLVVLPGRKGTGILVRCISTPIPLSDGAAQAYVHTLQDVTAELRKQRDLAYAARHDQLTGLLNRSAFDETLADHVARAGASPFALLYVDLDHFKALNDFAGHAAGDRALELIADAMVASLPGGSAVARLGGDEFAALVPCGDAAEARRCAEALLAAIQTSDLGENASYKRLGASIGIIQVRESGVAPADVLALADDACYAAKSSGRNRIVEHRGDSGRMSSALTAARIVGDIADAQEDGRLRLYGQEIRLLSRSDVPGGRLEVLARLIDRNGKSIPPGDFIPAAERFGRAAALDRWIIQTALRRFGALTATGRLTLGFNLSAQTLSDPRLWEFVHATLDEVGAMPKSVVFEITETAAVTNFEAAERFVLRARGHGCRISLDDFGAGLSSFDYLRRFPVDSLKINGSFIENLATSRFDRQIVSSINRVALGLGYDVVAEKIENAETLDLLRGMRVKFGQGYHFHKPEPLETLVPRLVGRPAADDAGADRETALLRSA
jgi:diguanylate cyclase (GGDEF)-like protein/PAS domain S-box-containing protein